MRVTVHFAGSESFYKAEDKSWKYRRSLKKTKNQDGKENGWKNVEKSVIKTFFVKMISDFKLLKIFSVHFTPIFESSESLFFVKCKFLYCGGWKSKYQQSVQKKKKNQEGTENFYTAEDKSWKYQQSVTEKSKKMKTA